jgi:hypothetical protein
MGLLLKLVADSEAGAELDESTAVIISRKLRDN